MLIYKLPQEIDFNSVLKIIEKNYAKADPMGKLQYTYWRHVCECQNRGGRLCPTFKSFLLAVKESDYKEAISSGVIFPDDIGTKAECHRIISDYYNNKKPINNVIYFDFNK